MLLNILQFTEQDPAVKNDPAPNVSIAESRNPAVGVCEPSIPPGRSVPPVRGSCYFIPILQKGKLRFRAGEVTWPRSDSRAGC